ncbi:hypothetical protein D3C80_1838570 [compost metagenome]
MAASMANDMPAEKIPHITASSSPLRRLNSSAQIPIARSFSTPAQETIATPTRAIATPSNVIWPPAELNSATKRPCNNGVIRVPTTSVMPMAIPMPIDIPR